MLEFYNYIVGFVDLLGQRNEYRGEGLIPQFSSPEDKNKFVERIKRTIGPIRTLQQDADKFLTAARGYKSKLRDSLPPDKQFIWDEMKKEKLQKQHWSDGIVYYASLGDPEIRVPLKGVYNLLGSLGVLCFFGLARKRPLRGGVDIGWAVNLKDQGFHGAALVRAYELESIHAKYPRIVLGDYAFDYLKKMVEQEPSTVYDQLNQQIALICLELIVEDMDGRPIIHYLGDGFKNYITTTHHKQIYDLAFNFINETLDAIRKTNDSKLMLRYHHLLEYFVENRPANR